MALVSFGMLELFYLGGNKYATSNAEFAARKTATNFFETTL